MLVLSDMAGAARELDSALRVNPHDHDAVADAILTALRMPLEERVDRWREANDVINNNDIFNWSNQFLTALHSAAR